MLWVLLTLASGYPLVRKKASDIPSIKAICPDSFVSACESLKKHQGLRRRLGLVQPVGI
ncbi:predicted protein [Sclerotinia sclerotiorum 1980 UF-70]|uniref:Uncharacterized protein n=1 Tax=Sclerotinia sclerotiorum (strain ATCC 18683 / 1980 / Ss-1) TaxID=665079 RepID=A7ELC9_SCLS1|nr:predicted protein [Sclerotinia sclerotiorum 1980 UF-70]EDO03645.1 predicted protein [Sclerotinia sclerotiorum 1980 UF-70]